jgi:hypothetical protein
LINKRVELENETYLRLDILIMRAQNRIEAASLPAFLKHKLGDSCIKHIYLFLIDDKYIAYFIKYTYFALDVMYCTHTRA